MDNINEIAGEIKEETANLNLLDSVHTASADEDLGTAENFGKFKDAKSLLNAYNALQSEFTRRCQKVKELERESAKFKKEQSLNSEYNEREREEITFLEAFPEAKNDVESLFDVAVSSGDNSKGRLGRAYLKKIISDYENKIKYYNSAEYVKNAINNDSEIKNQIIKEYLLAVEGSKPAIKLISGNGLATLSPPSKPKNLAEAGNFARQIFDNFKENINLWLQWKLLMML